MGLLVTLFLISSNVYTSVKAPSQRGFSFLEVWVLGSQGIIFLAILEYGFVLGWKKYGNENDVKPLAGKGFSSTSKHEQIKFIDMISLILSILGFFCFNVVYWTYCLMFV